MIARVGRGDLAGFDRDVHCVVGDRRLGANRSMAKHPLFRALLGPLSKRRRFPPTVVRMP